jgi:hypothetical protein
VDAVLEQIRPTVGAVLEERERVERVGELAEDHDPDLRVLLGHLGGQPDAPRRCWSAACGCR